MKEIKVYVDKLPEDCKDCPCCSCELKPEFIKIGDFMYCNLLKQKFRYKEERKKLKDCPLKSLHDHDKELVAKVLERVKKIAFSSKVMCDKDGSPFYGEKNHTIYGIYDYELDEIQKEFEK